MKIAFMLGEFPTLSETFILNQITGLLNRGHNVEIFATNKNNKIEVHEDINKYKLLEKTRYTNMPLNKTHRILKAIYLILINILIHPIIIFKSLNFFKYKKKALSLQLLYKTVQFLNADDDYDIIHCHFGHNGVLGIIMRDFGLINGKIITTFHGSDVTANYDRNIDKYKSIFNKSDLITVNSNFLKDKVVKLGCKKEKIVRLPVGVNLDTFKPNNNQNRVDSFNILSVARLVEYKGLKYSINAVSKLIAKYPNKNIHYYIVGAGKEKSSLQELIDKLKVGEDITLEGGKKREEVINYFNFSDIFVLPSINYHDGRAEAQGLVLQEAQAMKLPVISTNVGGIPEGIINNKTGFIIEDKNIEEIINKVEFFINNKDKITEMGIEGRKFVANNFDQHKLNDNLENLYYDVV